MVILQVHEYVSEEHSNFRKYALVGHRPSPYLKKVLAVVSIIYSDSPLEHIASLTDFVKVDITDNPRVAVGWVYLPNTPELFLDEQVPENVRRIHSEEELLDYVRYRRGVELVGCDPLIMRHISQPENAKTLTEAQYVELQSYMQALRDFPANVDLDNIVWPPKPAFMA